MKKFLCIITARSESKGIKKKNLRKILGKELVYYPIKAALESKYISKVILTTDGEKIAKVAKKYGAHVPFLRPKKYARDSSTSYAAIKHCLLFLKKKKLLLDYDNFILLEPTSPLTTSIDIDNAVTLFLKNTKSTSLISVCKTEQSHPNFLFFKNKKNNSFVKPFFQKKFRAKRRQDLSNIYFMDGSLYISNISFYLKNKSFIQKKTVAFEMPKYKSIEIDEINDLKVAEFLMKEKIK